MTGDGDLSAELRLLKSKLERFLAEPLHKVSEIRREMIPETTGIYAFYEPRPGEIEPEIIYVGTATSAAARPRLSTGLRFRIWEKHCGTRGEDDFRSDVKELRRLDSFLSTQEYLRNNCSCRWMEETDVEMLRRLEHFCIALLNPPFNA